MEQISQGAHMNQIMLYHTRPSEYINQHADLLQLQQFGSMGVLRVAPDRSPRWQPLRNGTHIVCNPRSWARLCHLLRLKSHGIKIAEAPESAGSRSLVRAMVVLCVIFFYHVKGRALGWKSGDLKCVKKMYLSERNRCWFSWRGGGIGIETYPSQIVYVNSD